MFFRTKISTNTSSHDLNTHRPTTNTEANDNASSPTTATTPHIKGISESISRIL